MAKNIQTPDWSEWLSLPRVKVWQACALSLDIEPNAMNASAHGWMAPEGAPFFDEENFPSQEVMKEFEKRARVLLANMATDSFSAPVLNMASPKLHQLRLDEFVRWAVTKAKWEIPEPLKSFLALDAGSSNARAAGELDRDQRDFNAAFAEAVCNEHAIDWRYWVLQMPSLTAAQASRLMSALDPDVFEDLAARPNENDPTRMCKRAKAMQRLAEAEEFRSASPTDWLAWADERDLKVHHGFRLAVEELTHEAPTADGIRTQRKPQSREDALTAVIEAAIDKAPDPGNASSVWAVLVKFADEPEKYPPLVGVAEGRIKIDTDNGIREFIKKNLKDRLARRRERLAKAR
jgi:hypothetical protein